MVPKDQLSRVTAMYMTVRGIIMFVAPPLGALLLDLLQVQGVLPLDILTALIAIVPLVFIAIHVLRPRSWSAACSPCCAR